jgi:hypothetical protein
MRSRTTTSQFTRRTQQPARPGRVSRQTHLLVWGALLVLLGGDYLLLSQALILLGAASSSYGSIGVQTHLVVVYISVAMVGLPHLVAVLIRRLQDGVARHWLLYFALAACAVWGALLVLVTVMRIMSSGAIAGKGTLSSLAGGAKVSTGDAVDLLSPDSLMAYLTAAALMTTAVVSFYFAYLTYRPLVKAVENAEDGEERARASYDSAKSDRILALGTLESARAEDGLDLLRLHSAKSIIAQQCDQLRADIATIIAEHESSPEATSQGIRALEAERLRRSQQIQPSAATSSVVDEEEAS